MKNNPKNFFSALKKDLYSLVSFKIFHMDER